jgi:hypothetical protein
LVGGHRAHSLLFIPEEPLDDRVFCRTDRDQLLSVQPLYRVRPEQRFGLGVLPKVAL